MWSPGLITELTQFGLYILWELEKASATFGFAAILLLELGFSV